MSSYIFLQANNRQFVCAENGGGREIVANRTTPGGWEKFELINDTSPAQDPTYGQQVSLRASNGQFVCAEKGGGGPVVANSTAIGTWETFLLVKPPNTNGDLAVDPNNPRPIALQTCNGQFVCAENGGGGSVVANRNAIGTWETFALHVVAGEGGDVGDRKPRFPVFAARDFESDGNHAHAHATITENGNLSGLTHSWTDNNFQGAHIVSNVALFDHNNNVLWASPDSTCGVAGHLDPSDWSNRTCNFSSTVPDDVLHAMRGIAIVIRRDEYSLFMQWLDRNKELVLSLISTIVTIAAS